VLAFTGRKLAAVLVFTVRGELIQAIHVIGDPRKLDFLRSQLTAPGVNRPGIGGGFSCWAQSRPRSGFERCSVR
jgi:hypothetical protein